MRLPRIVMFRALAGDDVGGRSKRCTDRDVARAVVNEDADIVGHGARAGQIEADQVGLEPNLENVRVTQLDPGHAVSADHVALCDAARTDGGMTAIDDQDPIVVGQGGAVDVEPNVVVNDALADRAVASHEDAMAGASIVAVAGQQVAATGTVITDAGVVRPAEHGESGEHVGRGATSVGSDAGPETQKTGAVGLFTDRGEAVALEIASRERPQLDVGRGDDKAAGLGRGGAFEVDDGAIQIAGLRGSVDDRTGGLDQRERQAHAYQRHTVGAAWQIKRDALGYALVREALQRVAQGAAGVARAVARVGGGVDE